MSCFRRGVMIKRPWRWLLLVLLQCTVISPGMWMAEAECIPQSGCEVAYAYYKAQANETLESIGDKFQTTSEKILAVNPGISRRIVIVGQPLFIPFTCGCVQDQLLHLFNYKIQTSNSVGYISSTVFEDLTHPNWIGTWNGLADLNFIVSGENLNIPVKCFCGDPTVSPAYGLFLTYVVAAGTGSNLSGLASDFNTSEALMRSYNPTVIWNNTQSEQHAFIPVKDATGTYPPYSPGSSNRAGEITTAGVLAGIAIGVGGALLFLSLLALTHRCVSVEHRRRQERKHVANKLKSMGDEPIFICEGPK